MKTVLMAAAAMVVLVGCNSGQPRIYRVAVDVSPAKTVQNPSCYKANAVPGGTVSETNLRVEQQWVIWDGVEGKQYLDMGRQQFKLGDSPTINFAELIEGQTGVFTGQRVENDQVTIPNVVSYNQVRQTIITVNFNDLGASPTGTINLQSSYACQPQGSCPMDTTVADPRSCTVPLNFVARRIDVSRIAAYQEEGAGVSVAPAP